MHLIGALCAWPGSSVGNRMDDATHLIAAMLDALLVLQGWMLPQVALLVLHCPVLLEPVELEMLLAKVILERLVAQQVLLVTVMLVLALLDLGLLFCVQVVWVLVVLLLLQVTYLKKTHQCVSDCNPRTIRSKANCVVVLVHGLLRARAHCP